MAKPTTHGQQLTLTAIDQVLKFSKSLKLKAIENITTLFWPKNIVISYLTFLFIFILFDSQFCLSFQVSSRLHFSCSRSFWS